MFMDIFLTFGLRHPMGANEPVS